MPDWFIPGISKAGCMPFRQMRYSSDTPKEKFAELNLKNLATGNYLNGSEIGSLLSNFLVHGILKK